MSSDLLFGVMPVLCFLLPVFVILYCRLYRHASIVALAVYYLLAIIHFVGAAASAPDFTNGWEVVFNYMEIPLVLSVLFFFCTTRDLQRAMHFVLAFFSMYELAVFLVHGLTPMASLYLMTPGLALIVVFSIILLFRQLQFTLTYRKNTGRALMLGAILFASGSYLPVFYLLFSPAGAGVAGAYAFYFFASMLAATGMSAGLLLMRHRIRALQELKVTRQELKLVFGN